MSFNRRKSKDHGVWSRISIKNRRQVHNFWWFHSFCRSVRQTKENFYGGEGRVVAHVCRSADNLRESIISFHRLVSGIKLRSLDLAARTFTHWAISMARNFFSHCQGCCFFSLLLPFVFLHIIPIFKSYSVPFHHPVSVNLTAFYLEFFLPSNLPFYLCCDFFLMCYLS